MMMPMGHRIKINQCFYIINSNIQPSKPMPLLSQNILILIPLILLILVQTVNANKIEYTYFIFTPTCYHSLIQSFNFRDTQCIKLTASKLLGYLLVAGGGIVKLPQVIKILLNKSVYGISFTSILMQSLANWVAIVYSWHKLSPFSIYGQNVFLLIQNMIIMSLFIVYGKNVPKGVEKPSPNIIRKYASIFVGFLALMFLTQNPNSWPQVLINYVLILQMVLFSSARLTQIFLIFSQKSTGNLALATCVLVLIGNLGRLFTVLIQISGDYLFVFSVLLASVLNGIIVFQFILYWSNTAKQQKLKQT